jgi:hypothetical protein
MHLLVFIASTLAFTCLALAISRHGQVLLQRALSAEQQKLLRMTGWGLLALVIIISCISWPADVGLITCLGWLTLAGLVPVLLISYWPWQPGAPKVVKKARPSAKAELVIEPKTLISLPSETTLGAVRGLVSLGLGCALLLPVLGFSWSLQQVPTKPLLRDDAVHEQLGQWTYVLAETYQDQAPQPNARGQWQKSFTILFCDVCAADIQTISLSIGKPGSAQRLGTAFNGRGKEKTAELVIPDAALASDELWLTVVDNSNNIHQQALPTARVSPALVRYLETRPAPAMTADEPEAAPENSPRQRSGAR